MNCYQLTHIYSILLLLLAGTLLGVPIKAQKLPNATSAIVLEDSSDLLRINVLLEEVSLNYRLDVAYHSYYKNRVFETQGGAVGKLLHGDFSKYDHDNNILEQGLFFYGLKNEEWRTWHANGHLKLVENWQTGIRHGAFEAYDEQGKLARKGKYRSNQLSGKVLVYENNEVAEVLRYKNGVLQEDNKLEKDSLTVATVNQNKKGKRKNQKNHKQKDQTKIQPSSVTPKKITAPSPTPAKPELKQTLIVVVDQATKRPVRSALVKVFSAKNRNAASTQGSTNADGAFQLTREVLDYIVDISCRGYHHKKVRIFADDRRPSILVELEVEKSCVSLSGVLLHGLQNFPINSAKVNIYAQGRLVATTFSNQKGVFEQCLECGQAYKINATKSGFHPVEEEYFIAPDCNNLNLLKVNLFFSPLTGGPPQSESPIAAGPKQNVSPSRINPAPAQRLTTANEPTTSSFDFYVIAGTFSKKENADTRLKEIKMLGYDKAQVIQYTDSGYFAVCVGMFQEELKAEQLKIRLVKQDRMKAFVKNMKDL